MIVTVISRVKASAGPLEPGCSLRLRCVGIGSGADTESALKSIMKFESSFTELPPRLSGVATFTSRGLGYSGRNRRNKPSPAKREMSGIGEGVRAGDSGPCQPGIGPGRAVRVNGSKIRSVASRSGPCRLRSSR